jgi:hypothetical protein
MTIEIPVQDKSQETSITNPAESIQTTPTISSEEFEAIKKALDDSKKEISGLNRKNSEYEKAIQQKELEKLSEVEKEKALTEIARKEREQEQQITESLRRERIIDKTLFDAGIPLEFAKRINGKDESEIQADVKEFKSYVEKLATERAEKIINEKLGGKPPVTGTAPGTQTITRVEFNSLTPDRQREVAAKYQITD